MFSTKFYQRTWLIMRMRINSNAECVISSYGSIKTAILVLRFFGLMTTTA